MLFQKTKTTHVARGKNFSRLPHKERKVISVRVKLTLILVTLVVAILSMTSVASADSIGQCNLRPGNEMHSVSQWLSTLATEGVLGQAAQTNFAGAGYNSVDGKSPRQWANERVVLVRTTSSYTGMDYSCRGRHLKPWKVTTNPAGTPTFMTLPPQYNKHNSSTHRTKKFSRRIPVHGKVLGFAPCANTHNGEASYFLYVSPKPKHKPKPHKPVQEVVETSPAKNICSNVVSGGSNNQQGSNCNTCVGTNVCNETVTPPPPCGCEPPPPPPPSCGETHTCPPHEEVCPPGTVGKPPHCEKPKEEVKHWTEISCRGFEEISGRESMLIDCTVSDDNGARISLDAKANDGNSRVSGINCFSDGGAPTCPSGGTFEFRVSGINDGPSVVYSSITATATANGVPKTFKSDPFPVDPAEGGF